MAFTIWVGASIDTTNMSGSECLSKSCRLIVVGDVHNLWNQQEDLAAIQLLGGDMTVFVGDFGDEDVELVSQVSLQCMHIYLGGYLHMPSECFIPWLTG